MNAFRTLPTKPNSPSTPPASFSLSTRHIHRERDFGVGYGNSSGYASTRRYADNRGQQPRFRCM